MKSNVVKMMLVEVGAQIYKVMSAVLSLISKEQKLFLPGQTNGCLDFC